MRCSLIVSLLLPALALNCPAVADDSPFSADIEGEFTMLAVGGNLDRKLDEDEDRDAGLRNITQIDFLLRYELPDRKLRYGGIFSFETELDGETLNQESFAFVETPIGEWRFGSDDPAAISLRLGASEIAAGTGGLDGEILDSASLVTPTLLDTDEIRAIYYSPILANTQIGLSFTPGSEEFDAISEAALSWRQSEDGDGLGLTLGGAIAEGGRHALQLSGLWQLGGMQMALSSAAEDNDSTTRFFSNAGIAFEWDRYRASLTGGYCHACNEIEDWSVVLDAETEILDGLSAFSEWSWFSGGDRQEHDTGMIGLIGLGLSF